MVSKDLVSKLKGILGEAEKVLEESLNEAKEGKKAFHHGHPSERMAEWHVAETAAFMALTSVRMGKVICDAMGELAEEKSEIKFRNLKTEK